MSFAGLLDMISRVHVVDTNCRGEICSRTVDSKQCDGDRCSAVCLGCGAVFGNMRVGTPSPLSIVLGIVLATGGTFDKSKTGNDFTDFGGVRRARSTSIATG